MSTDYWEELQRKGKAADGLPDNLSDDQVAAIVAERLQAEDAIAQSQRLQETFATEYKDRLLGNAKLLGITDNLDAEQKTNLYLSDMKTPGTDAHSRVLASVAGDTWDTVRKASDFEVPLLPYRTMAEAVAMDLPPLTYRVDGMVIEGGNTILSAQYKSGKTTLMVNLVKSLLDGDDFVGQAVVPVERNIVYWDAELEPVYARDQFVKIGLEGMDRLHHRPLKGYSLPITTKQVQQYVIADLRQAEADVWIIDTFGKVFDGDENSNTDVREWLHAVDEIKRLSGVSEVFIVTHTGHAQDGKPTRARGASYFGGWSDSNWSFEVAKGDDDTLRKLTVSGRGDLIEEVHATWDSETNVYARVEEPITAAATSERNELLTWLCKNPDSTLRDIGEGLYDKEPDKYNNWRRGVAVKVDKYTENNEVIKTERGKGLADLYNVSQMLRGGFGY